MHFAIDYRGERLHIKRNPLSKRVRRLRLNVHQDTRITVSAPKYTSANTIQRFIETHVQWIYQQYCLAKANYHPPKPFAYCPGELHWFQGKQYPLEILPTRHSHPAQNNQRITLVVRDISSPDKVQAALYRWYKKQALRYYGKRIAEIAELTPWVRQLPAVRIRTMKRQWGNCSANARLTFNTHLIKAPIDCIDYVILHELCHIQEFNHSPKFYALMTQVMPEWQTHKAHLHRLSQQLLH